jgi:hypothetical protein
MRSSITLSILSALLLAACAHPAPPPPNSRLHVGSWRELPRIRALDDVPLGIWRSLSGAGPRFTMERQGHHLRLWGIRETGERYLVHHFVPTRDGRFIAQQIGGLAWFVRDGDDVVLAFSACYIEGPYYRWRA